MEKNAIIKHEGDKWKLYSHKGKVLGTHDSRDGALSQERAVQASKHGSIGASVELRANEKLALLAQIANRAGSMSEWFHGQDRDVPAQFPIGKERGSISGSNKYLVPDKLGALDELKGIDHRLDELEHPKEPIISQALGSGLGGAAGTGLALLPYIIAKKDLNGVAPWLLAGLGGGVGGYLGSEATKMAALTKAAGKVYTANGNSTIEKFIKEMENLNIQKWFEEV